MDEFYKYRKKIEEEEKRSSNGKKPWNRRDKAEGKDGEGEKVKRERKESRNQEWSNLTITERKGLKKLIKRVRENEIFILRTDKSGTLAAMLNEDYLKMGLSEISNDMKMNS